MALYTRKDSPFYWYRIEGTAIRKSTGIPVDGGSPAQDKELRRQALEVYTQQKAAHAQATAGLPTRLEITVAAYLRWYEINIASHQRGYARVRSMLKGLHVAFGSLRLSELDAHRVQEWMTARRQVVAPRTVNRELDQLKAIVHSAVPKYLLRSPLSGVRRLRAPDQEPRVLTRADEARLLALADDELRAVIILALDTLLRLSSLIALRWEQVKPSIIVALNTKVPQGPVPITTRMRAALDRLPRRSPYVFAGLHEAKRGGAQAAKNRLTRQFAALCQRAGVPHGRAVGGLTFHALRHTGATRALAAGASLRTVMQLGGWHDLRSVLRYTHVTDEDVQTAAESIGAAHVTVTRGNQPRKSGSSEG